MIGLNLLDSARLMSLAELIHIVVTISSLKKYNAVAKFPSYEQDLFFRTIQKTYGHEKAFYIPHVCASVKYKENASA